ncbi:hypothetical protein GCM10011371_33290 [Novosphingobium marinum]|nr:hypothetical protein GCM10011371_33290 [Novosphingobium marinum]
MKRGVLLGSVAIAAFWAPEALAQVSIPLPQSSGPAQDSAQLPVDEGTTVVIPLPSDTPAEPRDAGPAPTTPTVPLGPHGRPDINPYERDIDMTVPLTFQNRSLGDVPLKLTYDDRYLIETEAFVRLMRTVLNDDARAALAEHLQGQESFSPEDLVGTGVSLTYDPSSLSVVVVDVEPEQRAVRNLFAPPRDDLDDVNLAPAQFSGYLNLNVIQTYVWEADNTDPPTINLDGAIRWGRIVFEGDAQLGERFGLEGSGYRFERNYARLVYDEPEDYRRWLLGDLDVETRGLQSYVRMGGVGVIRQQRRFNTFRAAVLQANRQLVVQRESTVRFLRNGSLYREMRLQPGRYDFSALPLLSGSNDVQIEVYDNSGRVQSLSYQQYLDPIDLDPGDYEYGAFLGPTSRRIGGAPDYNGKIAFSGFYRKAFFNRPSIGVGLQLSEEVQMASGQTQFVLGNGGRLLFDAAVSNSQLADVGFAGGASYEHFFDRGGLADTLTIRADYLSNDFATLGNPEAFNSSSVSLSAQYTRQFSFRFIGTLNGSYLKGRGDVEDSYRLGATGYYRLNSRWSFRAGVDYTRISSSFSRGSGFGANIALVFQPDYRRRAEARYETRDNLAELSYTQSSLNQLNSLGFGGLVSRQDGSARALGYVSYAANRFDASLSHSTFGPSIEDLADLNATTLRVGTSLAFAGGQFGIGRRINDSFMLLHPHKNLKGRSVVAGQSIAENDYVAKSGALGAAVNNTLGSYFTQSVQYDVESPPPGYDTGPGVVRVHPPYKSGYALRVGTDAFVSAMGTLMLTAEEPVSLIGGRVSLQDVGEGDDPRPIPFFTNSVGRFAIANLLPGRRYVVETYGPKGTIDRSFEFVVPEDTDGLVDLGTIRPGRN